MKKNIERYNKQRARKNEALGINYGTAQGRLSKDLLFGFAEKLGIACYRCGFPMTRDTFSIDHIEDWINSGKELELFFDLDNVTLSHLACNTEARVMKYKKYASLKERNAESYKRVKLRGKALTPTKRREKYLRTGN